MDAVTEPNLPVPSEVAGLPDVSDEAIDQRAQEDAAAALARLQQRTNRYMVRIVEQEDGSRRIMPSPYVGGMDADTVRRLDAFGTSSVDFVAERMRELASMANRQGSAQAAEQALNAALALVDGIQPENETEALLATQMAATHETAMRMLKRAAEVADPRLIQECGTLATKMLRTYAVQMETLSKVRRKGEQKVRVEHVHVHEGGQAIVGNVTAAVPLPGVGSKGS